MTRLGIRRGAFALSGALLASAAMPDVVIEIVSGIGMAVASGLYAIGVATTVLALVGLEVLGWVGAILIR